MARHRTQRPTDREVEILNALWTHGPSTVREVHEVLAEATGIGQTTVLKLMQIMTEKGLLERDASVRPQRYRPTASRDATQRELIQDLMNRAFGGSLGRLVLQALSERRTTAVERRRIRELLDAMEASGSDEPERSGETTDTEEGRSGS